MKPYGKTLGPKTVEALRLYSFPMGSVDREHARDAFIEKWSAKALYATVVNHGALFEYGVSAWHSWLTDEGKQALREATE